MEKVCQHQIHHCDQQAHLHDHHLENVHLCHHHHLQLPSFQLRAEMNNKKKLLRKITIARYTLHIKIKVCRYLTHCKLFTSTVIREPMNSELCRAAIARLAISSDFMCTNPKRLRTSHSVMTPYFSNRARRSSCFASSGKRPTKIFVWEWKTRKGYWMTSLGLVHFLLLTGGAAIFCRLS